MSIEKEEKNNSPKPIIVNPQGDVKFINLTEAPTTSEEHDDTDKLKAMRLMGIKKDLELLEKKQIEAFYNRISNLKLDLVKDAEKIKKMEIFIDYYFISNNSALYTELCEGELQLTAPHIYGTVVLFDKLHYTHKWDIRRIIDYFVRQNDQAVKTNLNYAIEFKNEVDDFYRTVILRESAN